MRLPRETIHDLVDTLTRRHSPDHQLGLVFDDCPVRVDSSSPALIRQLANYYRPYVASTPDPRIVVRALQCEPPTFNAPFSIIETGTSGKPPKEEYLSLPDGCVLRKRRTGMVFMSDEDVNLAVGPCEANLNQVVNFINHRYLLYRLRQSCVIFHAAGVAFEGIGLALAGFAGAGKSTLALHMMSRGTTFISNDRVLVRRDAGATRMYGLPKWPRVNPGTILNNRDLWPLLSDDQHRRYHGLSEDALWHVEDKYDAPIDTCFGTGRHALSHPMHALVILNWRREASPVRIQRIDLANREDLAPAFVKGPGVLAHAGREPGAPQTFEEYLDVLRDCGVYEITGGVDFEAACERCIDLMGGVTSP